MIAAPRTSGIFYSDGRIRGDLERHGLLIPLDKPKSRKRATAALAGIEAAKSAMSASRAKIRRAA